MITLSAFELVRSLLLRHSGIAVDADKEYFATSRLIPLLREAGLESLESLARELTARNWGEVHQRVVEAMVTTETSFFRDPRVFELLKNTILPQVIEQRAKERSLRICSAACSSGQEAYTIAMILTEHFSDVVSDWNVRVFAVDISRQMIDRARNGMYSVLEVGRGLPARQLTRSFQRSGISWQVKPALRSMIQFQQMNLAAEALPERFDIILMRNVLMYLEPSVKHRVIDMARSSLRSDGTLIVGATETLLSDHHFERHAVKGVSFYRPRNSSG